MSASDPRRALTRSAWILADEGHESGLAGQLTARGPRPETFWTLPLGLAFDEAEEASWLLIDDSLLARLIWAPILPQRAAAANTNA